MQDSNLQNGNGNGNGDLPDMTIRQAVKLLLDEITNVRLELKGDIQALDIKLSGRMDRLEGRMDTLETKMESLRMEVHQNQITFIKNHGDLEKRVVVLEKKAV